MSNNDFYQSEAFRAMLESVLRDHRTIKSITICVEACDGEQEILSLEEDEQLEVEEREWMAIVSKPRVIHRLRELGRQALEEDRAGETEEGGFDNV